MYLYERTVPTKIIVLDALNRRTDSNDLIPALLKRAEIGYKGELNVDKIWNEINLPSNSLLHHNYEIKNHQIDTLFVCPHFILILEIKNVAGFIWFEQEKHQFLRKRKTGEIESFRSPIEQVKRNTEKIEQIVQGIGLSLPIHKAIVIAEPSTVIGNIPDEIPIFHAIGLRTEVNKLLLKYRNNSLSTVHYELLVETFINLHQPSIYKPRFKIPPIRKGALCTCGRVMTYNRGFICTCGNKSKEALQQGLHDYRVIFSEWITNGEFRDFFFIDNSDLVNKLLTRMNLYYEGRNKGRRYLIPKDIWKM